MTMRRRALVPGFFSSQQVASSTIPARLLFVGLWCLADREGRLVDDPWRIRLAVFPTDVLDVDKLLDELNRGGLVLRYRVNEASLLSIPTFTKWQRVHPHEIASVLPGPELGVAVTSHDMVHQVTASRDMSSLVSQCKPEPSEPSGPSEPSVSIDVPGGTSHPRRHAAVGDVWLAWLESTGRRRSTLDAKRTALIQRALAKYPLEDVVDAVRGWAKVLHNAGQNSTHTVYNDIELLLRDSQHIERFRDAERGELSVAVLAPAPENPVDRRIRESFRALEGQRP